jgi:agmatine deiminase
MKLLDEERILVAEPPKDHELYTVYENIVEKELKSLKTVYGKPYEIIRIKIGRYEDDNLAAYTNSIIVNKNIYVPLFQIKEDSLANTILATSYARIHSKRIYLCIKGRTFGKPSD